MNFELSNIKYSSNIPLRLLLSLTYTETNKLICNHLYIVKDYFVYNAVQELQLK